MMATWGKLHYGGREMSAEVCIWFARTVEASALPSFNRMTMRPLWHSHPECAKLSFSSVFCSGFEHGHPATRCDQDRGPRPCSLHGRNMCAHYWLHWHHWKPPSSLRVLQVQKFLLWLIWLALGLTGACVQMVPLGLNLQARADGIKWGRATHSTPITNNLSVNSSCFKEQKKMRNQILCSINNSTENFKKSLIFLMIETADFFTSPVEFAETLDKNWCSF